MPPLISIVIPFYNSQNSIEDCLNAVFKSSYKNFEVIAVSDGSRDSSSSITKKFPCKIISLRKNRGSGFARNKGAKLAKGKVIVFLDSDVIIKKNHLKLISNIFTKKKYRMAQGVYLHKPNYKKIATQYLQSYQCYYVFSKKLKYINNLVSNFFIIEKKIFLSVKGFDPNFVGSNAEDADLGYKLINNGFKIPIVRKLGVFHKVDFGLETFINKITRIHTGEMKMFLRKKNILKKVSQNNYKPIILSIILLFSQIFLLLCNLYFKFNFIFEALILLNIVFLITQKNFLKFLIKTKGIKIFFRCLPFVYLHIFLLIYSFFAGLVEFTIFKKKY
tara:strand:- start:598 stop:1593 length:996 start_codon:yes stop_codon:yes gene_type:complete